MHFLLQEYEGAVEDRNHTGIMLIDRNDELCILYEKANTQEEVMRKGMTKPLLMPMTDARVMTDADHTAGSSQDASVASCCMSNVSACWLTGLGFWHT